MSSTGSLAAILVLVLSPVAVGQGTPPSLKDVPPLERTAADFYNAVAAPGQAVQVEWTAEPAVVALNRDITLTLTIRHAANPHELQRPDLGQVEQIIRSFQVIPRDDPPVKPGATEVRYTYILRPRQIGTYELPRFRYRYFLPHLPAGHQFRATYTLPLAITVEPPVATTDSAPPVPLDGPEEFFALAKPTGHSSPGRFAWLLPVLAVPVVVSTWVFLWYQFFPDAARLRRIRRNRAVRMALDRLRKAERSNDTAAAASAAFHGYVEARFGVPPTAQTPGEVATSLIELDQPPERAVEAEQFLRACDEARFGMANDRNASLTTAAESLILSWEGTEE